jgi:hypothetical protein
VCGVTLEGPEKIQKSTETIREGPGPDNLRPEARRAAVRRVRLVAGGLRLPEALPHLTTREQLLLGSAEATDPER